MNYQIFRPAKPLAPYVERIWVQEDSNNAAFQNYRPTTVLPTTMSELVFTYRDPFHQIREGQAETLPLSHFSGQRTKPIHVAATGRTGLIIVCLFPWSSAPFFGHDTEELTDVSMDLKLLAGHRSVTELECCIQEASNTAARVALVQSFLLHLLNERWHDALIAESISRINRARGNLPIGELARQLHLSRRQLDRRFKRTVGLNPKEFAGIIRFQKALYQTRFNVKWSDIVLECGYYDQAHLIKEVQRYSGYSPQKIFSINPPRALMRYFNAKRKVSHFYNTIYL